MKRSVMEECGPEILSLYARYICEKCGKDKLQLFNAQALPDLKCTHCGSKMKKEEIKNEFSDSFRR